MVGELSYGYDLLARHLQAICQSHHLGFGALGCLANGPKRQSIWGQLRLSKMNMSWGTVMAEP
jgi:hypothetical protein